MTKNEYHAPELDYQRDVAEQLNVRFVIMRDPDNPALWRFGVYYNRASTSKPHAPRLGISILDQTVPDVMGESSNVEMAPGDALHLRIPAPRAPRPAKHPKL